MTIAGITTQKEARYSGLQSSGLQVIISGWHEQFFLNAGMQ